MKYRFNFLKAGWTLGLAGFVLGIILILGIRVAAYRSPENIHYHANFAVYINGQEEQFKAMNYYEETAVTTCSASETSEDTPMSRTHMHGNVNDVVHVEDSRVTWGNFFTVLGWNIGTDYLATRDAIYQSSGQDKVTYLLNGKKADNVANTVIGDQDKLLVDYGSQTGDELNQEYGQIQNNALKADQSKDPASCGAHENSTTMRDRMRHMF